MVLTTCPECGKPLSSLATACPHCGFAQQGAAALAPQGAPGPEETLWTGTPSLRLLAGRIVGTALALVLIPTAAFLIHSALGRVSTTGGSSFGSFLVKNDEVITLVLAAVALVILLPPLFSLVRGIVEVKSLRYTITSQRILVEKGLFSKTLQEIDLRYVDETQFSQGLIERILGIGKVRVASTDAMTPRLVLVGILNPRAVRETLRAAAYKVSQRQFFTRST